MSVLDCGTLLAYHRQDLAAFQDSMSDNPSPQKVNFLLIGAGSIFTSMVVAGFLVGYWIDSFFDTQPLGLMVCGIMGFIGGGRKVYDILMKMPS